MANYGAFHWNFSLSTNPEIRRSEHDIKTKCNFRVVMAVAFFYGYQNYDDRYDDIIICNMFTLFRTL